MVEVSDTAGNHDPGGRIGPAQRAALDQDGYLLLRGAFSPRRIQSLHQGIEHLIERGRAGQCQIPWIDKEAGLPSRISHMMHPDKYEPAWGEWIAEDVLADLQALLGGAARHSLFGLLASGAGHGYRLAWHRDIARPGAADEETFLRRHHGQLIQFNAPVAATDTFLHVVPGSHLRASTAEEIAASAAGEDGEIAAAIEVALEPGDILYYNANLWHRGWNPSGRLRWTLHAAYWRADYPVMTHEHGQREALQDAAHLQRLPAGARTLIQRYLDSYTDTPSGLLDL